LPDLDTLDIEGLKALVMAHDGELLEHRSNVQGIDRLKLIIEGSVSGRISNRKRFMRRQVAFS
jgi:hypothetical protein